MVSSGKEEIFEQKWQSNMAFNNIQASSIPQSLKYIINEIKLMLQINTLRPPNESILVEKWEAALILALNSKLLS